MASIPCRRITPQYAAAAPQDVRGCLSVMGVTPRDLGALKIEPLQDLAHQHPLEMALIFIALGYPDSSAAFMLMTDEFRRAVYAWHAAQADATEYPDVTYSDWVALLLSKTGGIDGAAYLTLTPTQAAAISTEISRCGDLHAAWRHVMGHVPVARPT